MAETAEADRILLEACGIGKSYVGPILRDVAFSLAAGEVHALAGENGAGKSTFARILAGLTQPDVGEMRLRGCPYRPRSRRDAERSGVRMAMQELSLIPELGVAENLLLGRLPRWLGLIDRARLRAQGRALMARVGLDAIDPETKLGRLGIGHRQMVEIARSLAGNARILVLDEPTAMLTAREVDLLFAQIARLQAAGVGILYISHRLDEVRRIAGRITVLRDGRVAGTVRAGEMATAEIMRMMAGRDVPPARPSSRSLPAGPPLLEVRDLDCGRLGCGRVARKVSFGIARGEIFGLAGLVGSGRTEVLRAIFGADRPEGGEIRLAGARLPRGNTAASVRRGIAFLPEDRKSQGLLLDQPMRVNISLASLAKVARRFWLDLGRERAMALRWRDRLRLRCLGPDQPARQLSGGNQQKLIIARWLERDSEVLLFDEPTRGVDIAAKLEIYELLGELRRRGKAILLVSSELRELMLVCDRIGVMSGGRLIRIFTPDSWSEAAIVQAAFAAHAGAVKTGAAA